MENINDLDILIEFYFRELNLGFNQVKVLSKTISTLDVYIVISYIENNCPKTAATRIDLHILEALKQKNNEQKNFI